MGEIYRSFVSERKFVVNNVYRALGVDVEDVLLWSEVDGPMLADGRPFASVISLLDNEMGEEDPMFDIKRRGMVQGSVIIFEGDEDKRVYEEDGLQVWLDVSGKEYSVMSRGCEYMGKVVSLE